MTLSIYDSCYFIVVIQITVIFIITKQITVIQINCIVEITGILVQIIAIQITVIQRPVTGVFK
jgi:hypothetical protein